MEDAHNKNDILTIQIFQSHDSLSMYSMEQLGANNVITTQKSMVLYGTSKTTLLVYILRNAWNRMKQ